MAAVLGLSWQTGAVLALAAMAGDLLSIFVKRRLRLESGGRAPGIDQVPEALAPLLAFRDALGLSLGGVVLATVAFWLVDVMVALSPAGTPRIDEVSIDMMVLGFTLVVAVFTGIVFGLVPALSSTRPNFSQSLKEGKGTDVSSGGKTVRSILVVSEVALALMLLIGAGLGLFLAYLMDTQMLRNDGYGPDHNVPVYFSLIAIGGGLGLFASYRMEKKWDDENRHLWDEQNTRQKDQQDLIG